MLMAVVSSCLSVFICAKPAAAAPRIVTCRSKNINDVWGSAEDPFSNNYYNSSTYYPNIYVFGTGFTPGTTYRVALYDAHYPDGVFLKYYYVYADGSGDFNCEFSMSDPFLSGGMIVGNLPWYLAVYDADRPSGLPATFDDVTPGSNADVLAYQGLYLTSTTVSAITATPNPVSVMEGYTQQLTVMENVNNTAPLNITKSSVYGSSNNSLVTVSSSGLITAGRTTGTVNVTVTWNGFTTTVPVTVTVPTPIIWTTNSPYQNNSFWGYDVYHAFSTATYKYIEVFGSGFTPNTLLDVGMFDAPSYGDYLGFSAVNTDANGNFQAVEWGVQDHGQYLPMGRIVTGQPWYVAVFDANQVARNFGNSGYLPFDYTSPTDTTDLLSYAPVYVTTPATAIIAYPNPVNLLKGATQPLTVYEQFADGSLLDVTSLCEYASADPGQVTVTNTVTTNGPIPGGAITGVNPTTTPVDVTVTLSRAPDFPDLTTTVPVTVSVPPVPVFIWASPSSIELPAGETQQLTVIELMSDGSTNDVTSRASYTSGDSTVATVTGGGLVTCLAQGKQTTISVSCDNLTTTVPVTVDAPVVTGLSAYFPIGSGHEQNIIAGESSQLTAMATMSDGSSMDVTASASYQVSDATVATVSNSGLVTAIKQNDSYQYVTVSYDGYTDNPSFLVFYPCVVSIAASPSSVILIPGQSVGLTITATMSDGTTKVNTTGWWGDTVEPVAELSNFSFDPDDYGDLDDGVAKLSNPYQLDADHPNDNSSETVSTALDRRSSAGGGSSAFIPNIVLGSVMPADNGCSLITGEAPGSATIYIYYYDPLGGGSATTTVSVTVINPVALITATPSFVTLPVGGTQQLTVTAVMTDMSTTDVTSSASYTSSDSTVATVSGGQITGVGQGSATITVIYGGQTTIVPVTVEPAISIVTIFANPSSIVMPDGDAQQLQVLALMSDGTTMDITPDSYYWSWPSGIVTVSGSGLATGIAPGQTYIYIMYSDWITYVPVTITDTVASIAAAPASIELPAGQSQQLTVTATMADSSTLDVTSSASYASNDTGIASVSVSGLVYCLAQGSATITADYGGQATTIQVTVDPPASISASPASIELPAGETQQLSVTETKSDGTTVDVTAGASYTSSDTSIATVSGGAGSINSSVSGLVYCLAQGSATITVSYGGQTTTIQVTVSSGEPSSGGGGTESLPLPSAPPSFFERWKSTI